MELEENNKEQLKDIISKVSSEMEGDIKALESKIRLFGSFNVIANTLVRNQLLGSVGSKPGGTESSPVIAEYIALICLKYPYSMGIGEFTKAREVPREFYEINQLGLSVLSKYTFLHYLKFNSSNLDSPISDLEKIAQQVSAEELLVRGETFESHHWDLLEGLYNRYDQHFNDTLGFNVNDAIAYCSLIAKYMGDAIQNSINKIRTTSREMYDEIMGYKHSGRKTKNFYPQDYLDRYKKMDDESIKNEFLESMMTYDMVMMGHNMSFTPNDIAKLDGLDEVPLTAFLNRLSINFGEVTPDFSQPEIMHILKDKPVIHHEGRFICPSLFLLDYSLDRLFSQILLNDPKRNSKFTMHRHDYLLETGLKYIGQTLRTKDIYSHLSYSGGEMDGLVFCDNDVFFIEAKGMRITDRAKKGYIDRLEHHIDEIVKESHSQGIRTFNLFFGKTSVKFTEKNGRKLILDGSKFKNAYFISLTLDNVKNIAFNLKIGNSLGLFDKFTYPCIISLYDLRVVCEHMEGPAYFIQYLHRRKEFFQYSKIELSDELDVLGYYLKRNLRFDDLLKKHPDVGTIKMPSFLEHFNSYYLYLDGSLKKETLKMRHYTVPYIKNLVKALEETSLPNSIDASVQILEMGSNAKEKFMNSVKQIKKRYSKDRENHDFRIAGDDVNNDKWMISYWVVPNENNFIQYFRQHIKETFNKDQSYNYFAILDAGISDFRFLDVLFYQAVN